MLRAVVRVQKIFLTMDSMKGKKIKQNTKAVTVH